MLVCPATSKNSNPQTLCFSFTRKDKAGRSSGKFDLTHPTQPVTTEIYADDAFFDSPKNIGKFSGNVKVNDPRFAMQSEKLTAYIAKEDKGLEKAVAEVTSPSCAIGPIRTAARRSNRSACRTTPFTRLVTESYS